MANNKDINGRRFNPALSSLQNLQMDHVLYYIFIYYQLKYSFIYIKLIILINLLNYISIHRPS